MFEENNESIMARMEEIMELDSVACRMLSTACLLIQDDDSAASLLSRVREHMRITAEEDAMFEANYYLDYVSDIIDILDRVQANGPLPQIRETIRDHYEVLLYNRELLLSTLNHIKKETKIDGMRNNYWMN